MSLDLFHSDSDRNSAVRQQDAAGSPSSVYSNGECTWVTPDAYSGESNTAESGEKRPVEDDVLTIGRMLEVGISVALLLACSPIMLLVAVALRFSGNASIIYSQERVGARGRLFKIYKFRTMHQNAEARGPQITISNTDERITKLGRVLRKTKIDELPQLWNVIRNDMSLVGPRPERPWFHQRYLRSIENWEKRVSIKPGITGLAQITVSHDPKEKIVYDLIYLENKCWSLNIKILFVTGLSLFRKGASPLRAAPKFETV